MQNIGITGHSGFMGSHLVNNLSLYPEEFHIIHFEKDYFENDDYLDAFIQQCDVVIHLAAMNRHGNPQVIFDTNIRLVEKLISSLERTRSKPHVLFASSTQEERDNMYGKSKKKGRILFAAWAEQAGARFTGLIIPNVYGPFGDPYYNSVVATFSHQLTHGETPEIKTDAELKLIYVGELVKEMIELIRSNGAHKSGKKYEVPETAVSTVSNLLGRLKDFKSDYFEQGVVPELNNSFDTHLFNTFRSYIDHDKHFPVTYEKHSDDRGSFVETMRLKSGGQISFSTTKAKVTRGNHFHTRKIERFAVIKGEALIQMRKTGTNKILEFHIEDGQPGYVDMPVWYTHNITNTGDDDLYTIFWINEFYDPDDADTYFEKVEE